MRYFEDFAVGEVREYGPRALTREQIMAFGREYDPQPFHVDEEAARQSHFGGLIASGWQTVALCMRMIVEGTLQGAASLGSPGVDQIRWLKPVRPDDALVARGECIETIPSRSKPDRGLVKTRYEVRNQDGELVMTWTGMGFFRRRPH